MLSAGACLIRVSVTVIGYSSVSDLIYPFFSPSPSSSVKSPSSSVKSPPSTPMLSFFRRFCTCFSFFHSLSPPYSREIIFLPLFSVCKLSHPVFFSFADLLRILCRHDTLFAAAMLPAASVV